MKIQLKVLIYIQKNDTLMYATYSVSCAHASKPIFRLSDGEMKQDV